MARLTVWNGKKWTVPNGTAYGGYRRIIERLAAYENTGLAPREVEIIANAYRELCEKEDQK